MPIKAQTKSREAEKRNSGVEIVSQKSTLSTPTKQKQMKIDKFVRYSPLKTEPLEIKSENNLDDNWNPLTSGLGSHTESEEQKYPQKSPHILAAENPLSITNHNKALVPMNEKSKEKIFSNLTDSVLRAPSSQSPSQDLYGILESKNDQENLSINSQYSNFSESSDIIILDSNFIKDNQTRIKV